MPNKKKKTPSKAPQPSPEYRYVEAELVCNNDGTVTVKMPSDLPANTIINWGQSYVPVTFTN
jgi:hypothetical protein